jgi:tetratricopeptide (TPR) repeat protein
MIPLAAIALVIGLGQGTSQSPHAASEGLAEVRRLINAGNPKKALERLAALPSSEAKAELQVALLRGVALYHADQPAVAVEVLLPIVDRLPGASIERREAEQVLGLALFVIGRYAEAVPRLEATRRWAGESLELAHALGQAYVQTQKPDAAREAFATLFHVPADSAAAHLLAAQMMVRLENDTLAEAELAKAVAKDPKLPNAHFLLGQIALFRGRLADAVTFTERELAINPTHAMAMSQLGDALVRQGRWNDAIAALQKSIWINPFYSAPYILMGRAYTNTDRPAAAEAMLRRAIQYDPNNRSAHYQLAQLLLQLGRTTEAKIEFDIVAKLK